MKTLFFFSILTISLVFSMVNVWAAGPGVGAQAPGFSRSGSSSAVPGYGAQPGGYRGAPHPSSKGNQGARSETGAGPVKGDRVGITRQKGSSEDQNVPEIQGDQREECREFFNATTNLRGEFAAKRAAYFKARENSNINPIDIENQQKEIQNLFRDIEAKNSQNCRWIY